jgi:hypothetical protein
VKRELHREERYKRVHGKKKKEKVEEEYQRASWN